MNDQLQQELAELIGKASSGIDASASFLQAELPSVISQLLAFKLVSSAFEVVAFFAFLAAYAWSIKAINKSMKNKTWAYDEYGPSDMCFPACMLIMIGGAASIGIIVGIFSNITTILKIWIAPKIYLIEYAASLAK